MFRTRVLNNNSKKGASLAMAVHFVNQFHFGGATAA